MLLRGNHKSTKSLLKTDALESSMDKEVKHVWETSLIMYLVYHVNNMGIVLLGVSNQF